MKETPRHWLFRKKIDDAQRRRGHPSEVVAKKAADHGGDRHHGCIQDPEVARRPHWVQQSVRGVVEALRR